MKFMKMAFLISLCAFGTAAYAQPVQNVRAIIGAPSEIQLSETVALPIVVQVVSSNGKDLPDQVVVRADYGRFANGGPEKASVLLDLQFGKGNAMLSLNGYGMINKSLFKIWVTPAQATSPILGEANIKLRQQSNLVFLDPPQVIPADGETTAQLAVLITDQFGVPMEDVPCFLQGYILADSIPTALSRTDGQGKSFFTLPASSRPGAVGLFQVITKDLVSPQVKVNYQRKPEGNQEQRGRNTYLFD